MSQLFGDGDEILRLEGTLAEAITRFNSNFRKEENFDNQVQQSLMGLDSEMNSIIGNEEKLKNKILQLHVEIQQYRDSRDYMVTKAYKLSELEVMLERSVLVDQISLLERASFHRTDCRLRLCELEIHTELRGETVWVHRKLVALKPTKRMLISCAAASPTRISKWHNVLAVQTEARTFLLNDSIVSEAQLSNKSLANAELRAISKSEVLLNNFIIHGKNIQCLQEAQFKLNTHLLQCKALQSFILPETYVVEFAGQRMVQHVVSRQGQLINRQWLKTYNVPLSDEDFGIDIATIPGAHPLVEAIFLTEAGEFSVAKVSILSGGSVLLIFLACLICFCCCKGCRECVCITCSKSISAMYNVFTTESCRLRRANKKLRRDNRQKRKILEKNIREHELIDRALAKLGINITDTFEQNLEEGNVDHLGHQQTAKASSSSAVDTMAIVKEGETSI